MLLLYLCTVQYDMNALAIQFLLFDTIYVFLSLNISNTSILVI